MNPQSHRPPQPTFMPVHSASPTPAPALYNGAGQNGMNHIHGLLQSMLTQIQTTTTVPPSVAPQPIPQPLQQQPTVPSLVTPAPDMANLATQIVQQLQQLNTPTGSSAGLTSGVQNTLIPGPHVGAYPNDEDLLVEALKNSEAIGQTYRRALEGLHGVNHHLACQWKDYYLDNAQRINQRITHSQSSEKPTVVAKKPSIDTLSKHRNGSYPKPVHKSDIIERAARKHFSEAKPPRTSAPQPSGPNGSYKLPSRSPTPPLPGPEFSRGRTRFTEEDKRYLVRYARYRLAQDPNTARGEICTGLWVNAPHHSAQSWQSHWSMHRDEYDSQLPTNDMSMPVVDKGHEVLDTPDGSDYDSDGSDTNSETDRRNMGPSGGTIGMADKRVIARYIASFGREWASMKNKDRWDPFEAMYPQRSAKSWAEAYRRFEQVIDDMIKKYKKRRFTDVKYQTGRPTWASQSQSPPVKRARDEDEYYPIKRAREDV